ncbi:type VII secretion protein EssB [Lysinibacillus sp. 54212]|uniref:type VII secretion protein EssB n=1 Tax=Lysinibacillus sp. 54212 TaxID=3119829 RepID=UPI002FC636B2
MTKENQSYLENILEAKVVFEKEKMELRFHKEKINLDDELEINLLSEFNPFIKKEITSTEDALIFTFYIEPNYITCSKVILLDEKSRWIFASQLIKKIKLHSSNRLHLLVCPENILIDEGLTPYFLHYGVKESIPPYEKDTARIWKETKALIAAVIDKQYTFEQYIHFSSSIELSPITQKILAAESDQDLLAIIQQSLKEIEQREKNYKKVTLKRWSWIRNSLIGVSGILVPLCIYIFYSAFIIQPRQEVFINVQEPFIQNNYSEIINQLSNIKVEDMPKVIQFELATAYAVNETLTDAQKANVLKTISLQSDSRYLQYWIYIGRGQAQEALKISRQLEDIDLIVFALLNYEEQIKADYDMKDEKREALLDEIEMEKDKYTRQIEELNEQLKEMEEAEKNDIQQDSNPPENSELPEKGEEPVKDEEPVKEEQSETTEDKE